MAFCEKEKQLIYDGYTVVDNKFFINYLPDAPEKVVSVYLLGLALSDSNGSDNSCETIAERLGITCDDVMAAYQYWEELGLVHIIHDASPRVLYLPIRSSASALKKVKPSKYKKFSIEIQDLFAGGRTINTAEYYEYYMFLENTTFEQEALLAVAKYCIALKGNTIGYQYVLAVARNELTRGATTLALVSEHLNCQQKYDEDLKLVFKALKLTRKFEHSDREYYDKWQDYGFTQDVILSVAKSCKSGGMTALDSRLTEYYKRRAMSVKEISDYEECKTRTYELAKNINKTIGVYYQSVDIVVDEYVTAWQSKGYEDETLLAVAKYCFRSGIRTLNGMASVIDKLYRNGITTLNALETYLAELSYKDELIRNILVKCGLDRRVTQNDRMLFNTWTAVWKMPYDVIEYAAELSAGTNAPAAYVNRILSDYKQHGITTKEQAQNYKANQAKSAATAAKVLVGGRDMERRQYTDEEINALFTALDETGD